MRTTFGTGLLFFGLLISCKDKEMQPPQDDPGAPFEAAPATTPISMAIPEASGIAASYSFPGFIWVQEDSGNPARLSRYSSTGELAGRVQILGPGNRDWEDMTIANGPDAGVHYVYIGDIGNNNGLAVDSRILRFPEPSPGRDTVSNPTVIPFQYADGPRDAEAFLVDGVSHDIFIISKRDSLARIYKLTYPYTGVNAIASFVAQLSYSGVVSASLSNAGTEILVKTYTNIYYYKRTQSESIPQTLAKTPVPAPYTLEVQGEAVGFAADDQGYFTLSEVAYNVAQKLYFYKRK